MINLHFENKMEKMENMIKENHPYLQKANALRS